MKTEDEIEVMADNATSDEGYSEDEGGEFKEGWEKGYSKCQEDTQMDFARWIATNMWSIKETNFFIQDESKPKNHGRYTPRYYCYNINDIEEVKTLEELYEIFIQSLNKQI